MRKKIVITTLIALMSLVVKSQIPFNFNYQGVLRSSSGDLILNTDVSIRISILEGGTSGNFAYIELHNTQTNSYGQFNLIVGAGTGQTGSLDGISWASNSYYIKTEISEDGGASFTELGTVPLLAVPYAIVANSATKLGDSDVYSTSGDTLFVVKDHGGNVVFAVFPDGAVVYVNETTKRKIGGFAVSGRNPAKATEESYMVVTADSTRIYVNQDETKRKIGGFAVSGRNPAKATEEDYLVVTADSTRIYINQDESKAKIGGFAVSGRNPAKNNTNPFVLLTPENYFIGHQSGAANETGLYNSFYGYQTGMENQGGSRNIFIGNKTGSLNNDGSDNVFLGNSAGFNNKLGDKNIFLGNNAGYSNQGGDQNIFIGDSAGFSNNSTESFMGYNNIYLGLNSGLKNVGQSNIFFGTKSGYSCDSVKDCIFIGVESGMYAQGNNNIAIGVKAGRGSPENWDDLTGSNNVFIGDHSGYFNGSGNYNVCVGESAGSEIYSGSENVLLGVYAGVDNKHGDGNVFIGPYSGFSNEHGDSNIFIGNKAGYYEDVSNRLIIENSSSTSNDALIYGEFDNDVLQINNRLGIGIYPSDTANANLLVQGNIRVADGSFIDDGDVIADYVFEEGYSILSIKEHSEYMWKNKHLPKVDSKEMIREKGGVDMSERREQLLEELEIAHIYIDQLNSSFDALREENSELKEMILELKKEVSLLKSK